MEFVRRDHEPFFVARKPVEYASIHWIPRSDRKYP